MSTLRVEYLAALGLEPLVLRAGAGRGSFDALDAGAAIDAARATDVSERVATAASSASAFASAVDETTPAGVSAAAAAQTTPRSASGSASTSSRSRRDAPSDDAGLFAPQPARLCFVLSDGATLSGPHERLLRALAVAVGVSPAQLGFAARDDLPVIVFATEHTTAATTAPTAIHAPLPAALRSAQAKRALWPALRRLRRTLRTMP